MLKIICVAGLDIGRMTRSQEQIAFGENWAKEATWWLFLWYFIDIRGLRNGVHINWYRSQLGYYIFAIYGWYGRVALRSKGQTEASSVTENWQACEEYLMCSWDFLGRQWMDSIIFLYSTKASFFYARRVLFLHLLRSAVYICWITMFVEFLRISTSSICKHHNGLFSQTSSYCELHIHSLKAF